MSAPRHLFSAIGIELEYMIVDRRDLRVRPMCDVLLAEESGEPEACEVERGPIAWSNELIAHVVELKTNGPVPDVATDVAEAFLADVRHIDARLREHGAALLPGAMHPTMDPAREAVLWPHEGRPIYAAYDRIFGCSGHGWSNLQSCHLNLPFAGDDEFGRLHLAVRAVLPLLPALAASSPVVEGRLTPSLDHRLAVYATNQRRLPAIIGHVVPEPVTTEAEYRARILAPMFADIAPLDPEGELAYEWLNSRGAIARFERGAIEIRLLDLQETPHADLAISALVRDAVQAAAQERFVSLDELARLDTEALARVLHACIAQGERASIDDTSLLRAWGQSRPLPAGELWRRIAEAIAPTDAPHRRGLAPALAVVLEQGPLARRLLAALGPAPSATRIHAVYEALAACLVEGRSFVGP
jgi:glutamate---cysteine ligase / carboxylate-amine ligase